MSAAAAAAAALNAQLVQLRRQRNRQAIASAGNFPDVAIPAPSTAAALPTGPIPPTCADICRTGTGAYPQIPLLPPTIGYSYPGGGSGTPIFYGVFSDAVAFRPPQLIGYTNRPGMRLQ